MRWPILGFVSLLLLCMPAQAKPALPACASATSISVTVLDVLRDYKPYVDKCVRIRGFVAFRRLYDGIETMYRPKPDLPEPGYIAVYGTQLQEEWLWAYRSGATLIGRLSACDLIDTTPHPTKPREEVIVMVIGECHYRDGPLIYVDQVIPDPSVPRRIHGPSAYGSYGDLAPVAAQGVAASARRAITSFFEAIRRGDPKRLKALLGWAFSSRDDDLAAATTRSRSAYAFLIGRRRAPPIKYFVTTSDPEARSTIGCICRRRDCTDLWPIAELDTLPEEAWPYVCIEVYPAGGIDF